MLRLLLPLATGIILQWYLQCSLIYIFILLGSFLLAFLLFFLMPAKGAFHLRRFQGFLLLGLLAAAGMLLIRQEDGRQYKNWYGNLYTESAVLLVKLDEPLLIKERSYKADASVVAVCNNNKKLAASGKLLLYFTKDSGAPKLQYGQLLLINKPYNWTSFDVVGKIRNSMKPLKLKVGHAGTLDPLATGLLIVCTGKLTKQIDTFQAEEKEYIGTMILGATTPSYDLETEVNQ
ncbi:MAG: DUF4131 domain-containing protein, partial [Chitinophagaceae bacterium]